MRLRASIQMMIEGALPFAQRMIAFLLLGLTSLMVINPIWECHDHLDTLRHLGPHGVLFIILMVALAGISLLKSPFRLLLSLCRNIAGMVTSQYIPYPASAALLSPLVSESGPPLRI